VMSPIGTSRHFAATQYFGRFRGEADMTIYEYAPLTFHLGHSMEPINE